MPQKRLWDLILNSPGGGARLMIRPKQSNDVRFWLCSILPGIVRLCSALPDIVRFFIRHCSIFYSTLFDLLGIFCIYRELAEASRTTTKSDIICKIPQPGQPPNITENTTNLSIVVLYSPYRFVESLVVGLSVNQTKNGFVSMYVKC